MTNWNDIFENLEAKKQPAKAFNTIKKHYLTAKEGTPSFFRMIPSANGEIFRKAWIHNVPFNFVNNKTGDSTIRNRVVLCKGRDCPICALAKEMESSGIKDSFKYKASISYFVTGVPVKKVEGVKYQELTTLEGKPDLGIIVLGALGRQSKAFEEFLKPENLSQLGDMLSSLEGLTWKEVLQTIFANNGLVIKYNPSKDSNGRWTSILLPVNGKINLPDTSINLDLDIYPETDMNDEVYENCVGQIKQVIKNTLEFRKSKNLDGSDSMVTPSNDQNSLSEEIEAPVENTTTDDFEAINQQARDLFAGL